MTTCGVSMLIDLLRTQIPKESLGEKFVLIRFVQLYGINTSWPLSVLTLAKAVGVTDRVASSAIKQLVAKGLLVQQSTARTLGRPTKSYSCSSDALAERVKTVGDAMPETAYRECIEGLLNGVATKQGKKLLVGNRFLLAVLLAHADEFGVVRGLGSRVLSNLTGLKKEALRQRIESLMGLHYIRAIVPGVTGSKLFKPTPSLYFLNFSHPVFFDIPAPLVVVLRTRWVYRHGDNLARQILNAVSLAKLKSHGKQFVEFCSASYDVADLFDDRSPRRLGPMLQSMIDSYASLLLSKHFDAITEDEFVIDELYACIQADFSYLQERDRELVSRVGRHGNIALLLYRAAVMRAQSIKAEIKRVGMQFANEVGFLVLPPSKEPGCNSACWTLLVITKAGSTQDDCAVYDIVKAEEPSFLKEAEIPLMERYCYGLLTRTKISK